MRHLMTLAEAPPIAQRQEPTINPPGAAPASPGAAPASPGAAPASPGAAPASPGAGASDAVTALTQAVEALKSQHLSTDQIKAILTQWKQELNKPAQPQARPYRYRNQSWQVVDGKWINTQTKQPAPTYYVAQLNAWKKKVDAQRASGNLTDSTKPRTPAL